MIVDVMVMNGALVSVVGMKAVARTAYTTVSNLRRILVVVTGRGAGTVPLDVTVRVTVGGGRHAVLARVPPVP